MTLPELLHFLADMGDLVRSLNPDRLHGDPKEKSSACSEDPGTQQDPNINIQFRYVKNDVQALSIQNGRKCEKQQANKDLFTAVNFLKKNDLLAVSSDKGCGFYVKKKSSQK